MSRCHSGWATCGPTASGCWAAACLPGPPTPLPPPLGRAWLAGHARACGPSLVAYAFSFCVIFVLLIPNKIWGPSRLHLFLQEEAGLLPSVSTTRQVGNACIHRRTFPVAVYRGALNKSFTIPVRSSTIKICRRRAPETESLKPYQN